MVRRERTLGGNEQENYLHYFFGDDLYDGGMSIGRGKSPENFG